MLTFAWIWNFEVVGVVLMNFEMATMIGMFVR